MSAASAVDPVSEEFLAAFNQQSREVSSEEFLAAHADATPPSSDDEALSSLTGQGGDGAGQKVFGPQLHL